METAREMCARCGHADNAHPRDERLTCVNGECTCRGFARKPVRFVVVCPWERLRAYADEVCEPGSAPTDDELVGWWQDDLRQAHLRLWDLDLTYEKA